MHSVIAAVGSDRTAVIVAVIALGAAVVSAALSLYGNVYSTRFAARRDAESVLARYREPLVDAAYELQSRLYNILELDFLANYYVRGDAAQQVYAIENTLYVVAQYFGWSEILRREIQFLSFGEVERTRAVSNRQREIVHLFQSDAPELGRPFLVWRGEQRAIGECMIVREDSQVECLGYAGFVERQEPSFRHWFARLRADIEGLARSGPNPRLHELQHGLVDLVRELDPSGVRYSDDLLRKA